MFIIERDCCTSGNCINCMHLPYGRKIRLEQTKAKTEKAARMIVANWTLRATLKKVSNG